MEAPGSGMRVRYAAASVAIRRSGPVRAMSDGANRERNRSGSWANRMDSRRRHAARIEAHGAADRSMGGPVRSRSREIDSAGSLLILIRRCLMVRAVCVYASVARRSAGSGAVSGGCARSARAIVVAGGASRSEVPFRARRNARFPREGAAGGPIARADPSHSAPIVSGSTRFVKWTLQRSILRCCGTFRFRVLDCCVAHRHSPSSKVASPGRRSRD